MDQHYKIKLMAASLVACQTNKNSIYYFPMAKNIALTKIESHEKLCRIMQKQTHDKIHSLEKQMRRIETILLTSVGALITGMAGMIYMLITK